MVIVEIGGGGRLHQSDRFLYSPNDISGVKETPYDALCLYRQCL